MDGINSDIENASSLDGIDLNSEASSLYSSVVSKYKNSLGFSSSYGSKPTNIGVTLYGKEYNIIDFSILDSYISIVRSLFLSIAYILGFMILLKKD